MHGPEFPGRCEGLLHLLKDEWRQNGEVHVAPFALRLPEPITLHKPRCEQCADRYVFRELQEKQRYLIYLKPLVVEHF